MEKDMEAEAIKTEELVRALSEHWIKRDPTWRKRRVFEHTAGAPRIYTLPLARA